MTKPLRASPHSIMGYLAKNAPEIADLVAKDMTTGDVHHTTALGNERENSKGKSKFSALVAQAAAAREDNDDDEGDEAEKSLTGVVKVSKADPDQMKIWGWASVVEIDGKQVVDKQGDVIYPEDLQKAAHDYVLYSRQMGDMHERVGTGRLVESVVFTADLQKALGIDLKKVGWFVGFKVDDADLWKNIKGGKMPEFSIGGKASRVPL